MYKGTCKLSLASRVAPQWYVGALRMIKLIKCILMPLMHLVFPDEFHFQLEP